MGRKTRNKYYLSGKTKRVYRKNAARMWQVINSKNTNITTESKNNVQSTASLKTADNVIVNVLTETDSIILKADNPVDEMNNSTSAVAGSITIGCGYSQLKELTCAIGLAPMSDKLFMTIRNLVKNNGKKVIKSLSEAGKDEYDLAVKEGRVYSDGIPVVVIADGCYARYSTPKKRLCQRNNDYETKKIKLEIQYDQPDVFPKVEIPNYSVKSENISMDQKPPVTDVLLNETAPDDNSVTVKEEFEEPDNVVTCESRPEDQNIEREEKVFAQCNTSIDQTDINKSDGETNSDEEEDKDDFVDVPYMSRADMVLKMDNITKAEKDACYELFDQELVEAVNKYNFKTPNDDESLFDFLFCPLPTPPIAPELKKIVFSQETGPVKKFAPYEAFSAIWNDAIMDIVRETNKNGKKFYKKSNWTDTTIDELYVYFALTLATSDVDDIKQYWNTSSTDASNFSQAMTYERFVILNKFVSSNDWNIDVYSQPQAKLFQIKPIVYHLSKSFSSLYRIGQDIVIDEPSLMTKNKKGKYQFLKNKCKMQKIDVSDANTGYLWKFDILAQDSKVSRGIPPLLILKLLDELRNKGHTVWSNNVFNRFILARVLKELGFNSVGTLRIKDILHGEYTKLSDLQDEEIAGCTSGDLDFIAWRNNKLITFVSSYHGKTTTEVDGKVMPAAFNDYNNNVQVLDRRDKILAGYNRGAKGKSWSQLMFRRLLNISVFNSLILHKHNVSHSAGSYKKFRFDLIHQLVKHHRAMSQLTVLPSSVKDEKGIIRRVILPDSYWEHFPQEISGVDEKTKQQMQKPCFLCQKTIHVWCPGCNVALCLSTCHRLYHTHCPSEVLIASSAATEPRVRYINVVFAPNQT